MRPGLAKCTRPRTAWASDPPDAEAPFGSRRQNPRGLAEYLAAAPRAEAAEVELLAEPTARGEAVFLALRTRAGLEARRFEERFGARPRGFFAAEIDRAVASGLLEESAAGDLRLSRRGWLLSDLVCESFVADPADASGAPS